MQQQDLTKLQAALAADPAGVLEQVAHTYNASTADALKVLPDGMCSVTDGAQFARIMEDVATWGDVLFLVHTADVIAEFTGPVPAGKFARGYFNLFGKVGFSGHIRAENCAEICFVRRPFMNSDTRAIWFLNKAGEPMFKIFVGRNADRSLKADQTERFEALCASVC